MSPARPRAVRNAERQVRRTRGIPGWLFAPAAVGALFVIVPLLAIVLRVHWAAFPELVTSAASLDALRLSVETALISTAVCLLFGVPMALVLARARFPGQRFARALVLVPLVLPPVVAGLALLYAFGRRGLLGGALDLLGIQVPFTTTAVVLAQAFVALPFVVITLEGTLRSANENHEEIAAAFGASPSARLWRVTIPALLPALGSGAILAFARCLGEFGATITVAGSLQGVTRTLPLEIYLQNEQDPDAAVALSLVLIVVAVVVVAVAGAPWRRALVRELSDSMGTAHPAA